MQKIGVIASCYKDKFGTPRQPGLAPSSWARLQIDREWQPELALAGLEGFSHLWLIFQFHQNTDLRYHAKVHPPRLGGQSMGVFATRSPHRPNPIGLSLVKIEAIEKDSILLSGVDVIDGTPVLDIKPYLPEVEAIPQARSGWSKGLSPSTLRVKWTDEHLKKVQEWSQSLGHQGLKSLIEETLCLDPRPVVYRGYEGEESPYRQSHAVRLFNGDIHFSFCEDQSIEIHRILIGSEMP
ncbi:MAG: tRNA (N6-threonylcarbamoyladenosine(37)-N6)-methyltransferase TrmO [Bdellovibrio sp. CG10_big_fil_rev_8_21_14_0_10_47_8]|nr:MAG: tRNA (N6-threonylcarbamoyladenosine(37)-N6)-methyltransferase TrmO [Bdellovibrio sp. CG10_big_fil_rev_8_21_14_0_10_47_8]